MRGPIAGHSAMPAKQRRGQRHSQPPAPRAHRDFVAPAHFGSSTVSTRSTRQLLQRLLAPAGPMDDELVDRGRRAQSEVQPAVVLREIARAGHALRRPALAASKDFDARADAVAIALSCPCPTSLISIQWPVFGGDVVHQRALARPDSPRTHPPCRRCRSRQSRRRAPRCARSAPGRPGAKHPRTCRCPARETACAPAESGESGRRER